MTTQLITVDPNTDVREIARRLIQRRISAVPVVEHGRIVGIVSEGDLMRRSESGTERQPSWWLSLLQMSEERAMSYVKAHGHRAADVMTEPVITVNEEVSLESIAETLEKHRIKRVPVIRGDELVGIVSRADVLHGLVARKASSEPSPDDRRIKSTAQKKLADGGMHDELQARDVMTTRVVTVEPDTGIEEVAKSLLENRISALPVVDRDGHLVGIVSEGDLTRHLESETERRPSWWLSLLLAPKQSVASYVKTHGRHAKDIMTRKLITVEDSARIEEIAEILEKHHIKRVPVLHEGKLVGIVSRANLLHGLVARQTGASATMDDRRLKAAVEKNISNAGVRTQLLSVVVSGGVVHVWGVAQSPEEQAAVRVAAESVPGAKEVRTNVDVLPSYMRFFV